MSEEMKSPACREQAGPQNNLSTGAEQAGKMYTDNSQKATQWLRAVAPEGFINIVTATANFERIETRTFIDEEAMQAYIKAERSKHRGIFWQPNECDDREYPHARPKKPDVTRIRVLHLDLDFKDYFGENRDVSQAEKDALYDRIRRGQGLGPNGEDVPPTAMIFSGGGFHVYWVLRESLEPTQENIARVEAINANVARIYRAGSGTHDISRLLRVPGTTNFVNDKKRAAGRTDADVTWAGGKYDARYTLDDFATASPKPKKNVVDISENVKRLNHVDELDQWNVSARVKVIVVQGYYPDEPKEDDDSRSAWLFDAVCNMLRAGVPDEVVYSVITDPQFGISASVLEKKGQARRYALKQITSAKEFIEEPWLAKLNERYFCVTVAGKFLIGEYKMDYIGTNIRTMEPIYRRTLHFLKPEEFCKIYENIAIEVGQTAKGAPIYKELGLWWRKHPQRRQYGALVMRADINEELIYAPDSNLPDLNLWRGFQVEPVPGEKHFSFKAMLRDLACMGDEKKFEYLWNWMALKVQNPALRMNVAPVFYGLKGIGKTFVWRYYGEKLFGHHCIITSNPDLVAGKFNAPLRDCLILVSDEAIVAKDKKAASTIKTRITGDEIPIERKGIDIENVANMLGVVFLSNDAHVIEATPDERRFFAAEFSDLRREDRAYFQTIAADLEDHGGLSNLLYELLNHDVSNFDPRAYPRTAELEAQIAHTTMNSTRECVQAALEELDNACFQMRDLMLVLGPDHKEEVIKNALIAEGWRYGSRKPTKLHEDGTEESLAVGSYWHRKGERSYRVAPEPRGDINALVYTDAVYAKFKEALWVWFANYRGRVMRAQEGALTVVFDASGCPTTRKLDQ